MIVITGAIRRKSVKPLTPAQSNIGNTGAKIITAVPKSGWFNTKNEDMRFLVDVNGKSIK